MDNKQYIVALEIASSHVAATAAAFNPDSKDISELCSFEEPIKDCVRYGCIINVEELLLKINIIFNRIIKHPAISPKKISSVFIGLNTRSMHTATVTIEKNINEEFPISETLINSILAEAEQQFGDVYVLKSLPKRFEVDGKEVDFKPGTIGSHIKAEINVITCRTQIVKNIKLLLGRAGLQLAGFVCTPLATANLTLSEEEKLLGCMLVDLGADVTTVSIYKADKLQYMNVIPMGSRNITKDLTSLNLLEDNAEIVKKTYGILNEKEIPNSNIYNIKSVDIANYIKARAEEIFINIANQIKIAGFTEDQLPKGFVFIGKGAKLKGLESIVTKYSNMSFRLGGHIAAPGKQEYADKIQLLSILDTISEEIDSKCTCLYTPQMPIPEQDPEEDIVVEEKKKPEPKKPEPKKKKFGGLFSRIKGYAGDIMDVAAGKDSFDDDDDDEK